MKKNISILLAFFFSMMAYAQHALNLTRESSGLSSDEVRCILCDSRGYLWVGTEMGLDRYDGTRIKTFKPEDYKLKSNYIFCLFEDKKGNVWFGTQKGAAFYNYESDSFVVPTLEDGTIPVGIVSSIAIDSQGSVWFSTNSGNCLYRYADNRLSVAMSDLEIGPKYLVFDDNDKLFCIVNDSLMVFNNQKTSYRTVFDKSSRPISIYKRLRGPVVSMFNSDILFFATETAFYRFNIKTGRIIELIKWKPNQYPVSIIQNRDGSVWVSTSIGLEIYNQLTTEISTKMDGVFCMSVSFTQNGGYWVGTTGAGVKYFGPEIDLFKSVSRTEEGRSMSSFKIMSVSADSRGLAWIATNDSGLFCYNQNHAGVRHVDIAGIPNSMNCVCADDDKIWVGANEGLFIIDLSSNSSLKVLDVPISRLLVSRKGSLIAGDKSRLWAYDYKSEKIERIDSFSLSDQISQRGIVEDKNGTFWIPTYASGLVTYNPADSTTNIVEKTLEGIDVPEMISSVFIDRNDNVWIVGHDAELINISKENFKTLSRFSPRNNSVFSNVSFLSALQGREDDLWVASTAGLINYDSKTGLALVYTERNGLVDDSFLPPCCKLPSGELIFTTKTGLLTMNPSDFNRTDTKVEIVELRIGENIVNLGRNINYVESLKIPFHSNSFGFEFATPGHIGPNPITCKLSGFEKEWQYLSDNSTYYYNVPPGEYKLFISGHKPIRITIVPPFWSSVPGIMLIVAISLLLSISTLYYFIKRKEKKKMQEEKERSIREKLGFLSGFVALEQFEKNDVEKSFMTRMDAIVTEHLSDSGFGVEQLASELSMSHTSLGRHTLASFGTSPIDYIKTKRLAVAMHLLKQNNLSVSEIAYRCGFSSLSYFSRSFKDAYGFPPSNVTGGKAQS